jgi:circadian clock protein KaiC
VQKGVAARERSRVSTGVQGLDGLLSGGFPKGSMIAVAGRPGTGKTLLASEFLFEGATHGESSLYVSFAETKEQFLDNAEKFGLHFEKLIDTGIFSFLDLTTVAPEGVSDALDLIVEQVGSRNGKRLVIDSFTTLAQAFEKVIDARTALHVVLGKLVHGLGCTTVVLTEMPFGVDRIGMGIEEFVADGIIFLDMVSHKGIPKRTISIRKMRGTEITLRPSSYEITKHGITIFPTIMPLPRVSIRNRRVQTGVAGFDELVDGGLMERSVTGLAGAAGTGKTTFGLQFVYSGAKNLGQKGLLISFNEPAEQVRLVSHRLGMSRIEDLEKQGKLKIESILTEEYTPEGLVLRFQELLKEANPIRVVLDDVTALENITSEDEFYRLLDTLVTLAKQRGATVIVSITTDEIVGTSITGKSLSTALDGVIMLRYVELEGRMDRTMIVLKMRATKHDTSIREFIITRGGIRMESALQGYTGFLSGAAKRTISDFEDGEEGSTSGQEKTSADRRRSSRRD